jgi:2-polyprenyl-3-methyl-5-hydroxy-6-metoxy-1,4-benzoquinol methylase
MKRKESKISKHRKYTNRNLINRYLISNFFNKVGFLLSNISFESVLDVGCGEGILLLHIREHLFGKRVFATDIGPIEIETAKKNIPFANCIVGSIYKLPFVNREFDLVICTEVLEHLNAPSLALQEIRRVTARYCILSVPNEPVWRFLNIARGAYITNLGDTPAHVNHWRSMSFQQYVSDYFQIIKVIRPLPWTLLLCSQKNKLGNFT